MKDIRSYGPLRDSQHLSDLSVGKSFRIEEHNGEPLSFRQTLQGPVDPFTQLSLLDQSHGRCFATGQVRAHRIGFPDLSAATKVVGRVDHDTQDPGTELPCRIVPVECSATPRKTHPVRRRRRLRGGEGQPAPPVVPPVRSAEPAHRTPHGRPSGRPRPGRRRLSQDYAADDSDVEFRTPGVPVT